MANTKSPLATLLDSGQPASVRDMLARTKFIHTVIPLAAQANGDTVELFDVPAGFQIIAGFLLATAGLGGTVIIAIGVTVTAAKYRAAAIFNTADAPTLFGVGANMLTPLTALERWILTVGAAALPGSGSLRVGVFGIVGD